jgi:renalase
VIAARHICLSLPAEQLLRLAAPFLPDETRTRLENIAYEPAWTVIARLAADIPADWTALEFKAHPVLGLVCRDHTKRGTADAPPVVIAHASGAWSRDHMEDDKTSVQQAILQALESVVGAPLAVSEARTHRWRYATPTQTFGADCWMDASLGLSVCGDGCGGTRLENALTTGWKLAEAIGKAE